VPHKSGLIALALAPALAKSAVNAPFARAKAQVFFVAALGKAQALP